MGIRRLRIWTSAVMPNNKSTGSLVFIYGPVQTPVQTGAVDKNWPMRDMYWCYCSSSQESEIYWQQQKRKEKIADQCQCSLTSNFNQREVIKWSELIISYNRESQTEGGERHWSGQSLKTPQSLFWSRSEPTPVWAPGDLLFLKVKEHLKGSGFQSFNRSMKRDFTWYHGHSYKERVWHLMGTGVQTHLEEMQRHFYLLLGFCFFKPYISCHICDAKGFPTWVGFLRASDHL